MTNYILSWETIEAGEQRERMLFQCAKELMKVHTIPDSAADGSCAEFVLLDHIETKKYTQDKQDAVALEHILQGISAQVGYEKEWRLIIFLMRDVDLFGAGCDSCLVKFLAHVMGYEDSPEKLDGSCYLVCEKPENIWLVSLKNEAGEGFPPLAPPSRPDETDYSRYPSNCRFLQYGLDYQHENDFSRALLEMHCGIRSLARNILPPDLLHGNSIYSLKTELDEQVLCDSVGEYDRWLRRVEQTLQQQERQLSLDTLSKESAPTIDSIDESRPYWPNEATDTKKFRTASEALRDLEAQVDDILDKDGQLERRNLQEGIERLQLWETKQGHQMMSASTEKQFRKEMEDLEQEMLNPDDGKASNVPIIIGKIGDWIFNLRGSWRSIRNSPETDERTRLGLEREYRYVTKIEDIMGKNRLRKMWQVVQAMMLFFLFELAGIARVGAKQNWGKMIIFLIVSIVSIRAVYFVVEFCYKERRKEVFQKIVDAQSERILQNRRYFNKIGKYLSLSWVINYNDLQKEEMEDKRVILQQRKEELEQYKAVCAQLKICCIGMRGSGQRLSAKGSIQRMLAENSRPELFGIQGRLPELALNGNRVTGAFPFIKTIRLKKVPTGRQRSCPAAGAVQEKQNE